MYNCLSLYTECVCEHQSDHVSREPTPGVRPLRLSADPADLRPVGTGVEGLCCGTGRAEHAVGDVCQLPSESRPGKDMRHSDTHQNGCAVQVMLKEQCANHGIAECILLALYTPHYPCCSRQ